MGKSVFSREYQQLLQRLKEARTESGLTQMQVAEKLEKPQSFVSKAESGQRRLDPIELQALARLYKKPTSYFLK